MNSNQPNQLENTTLDRPLKVCILNIDYSKSSSPFKQTQLLSDPRGYLPSNIPWEWQTVFIDKVNSFSQIQKLKQKFDLFFNFCDGLVHEDRAGEDVIKALEHFQVPFVGSNSHFFGISKQNMKAICSCSDILTAPYQFIMNEDDIETSIKALKTYPLIVKHYNGRGSLGISKDSKVHNEQELRTQIKHMLDEYGGALIEEFIEGREFSVLMFQDHKNPEELIFLNPVELVFKDGETFNHFDQANSSNKQVEGKPVTDTNLIERLYSMSRMAFSEMYGSGFARLDARLNNKGELLFLELEQMPRLFYPSDQMSVADLIISLDKTTSVEKVIDHMVKNAFEICKRKQKPFVILQRDIFGGSGLFAARDLKEGEIIVRREERQRFLVSRTYAEKNFKGIRATLFSSYAYPMSDDIFVTWSDVPNEWTPINHSCEPTLWYPVGEEDLVTRCDVKKGTELTLDYCICYIDKDLQFDCQCGQPTCRGKFTSQDWRKKELIEKYKGHFSLYGEKRIKALLQEERIPVDPVDREGRKNKTARVKITDKCL